MMLDDPLGPLGKLLAELLGELGGIAKVLVVDVDVSPDDRLDAAAYPIRGFSLLNPNRLEQIVDIAPLCFCYPVLAGPGGRITLFRPWAPRHVASAPAVPVAL